MSKTLVLSAVVYASINASVLRGFQNLSQGYKHRMSSNAKACIFIANVANYLLEIVSITQKVPLFFSFLFYMSPVYYEEVRVRLL